MKKFVFFVVLIAFGYVLLINTADAQLFNFLRKASEFNASSIVPAFKFKIPISPDVRQGEEQEAETETVFNVIDRLVEGECPAAIEFPEEEGDPSCDLDVTVNNDQTYTLNWFCGGPVECTLTKNGQFFLKTNGDGFLNKIPVDHFRFGTSPENATINLELKASTEGEESTLPTGQYTVLGIAKTINPNAFNPGFPVPQVFGSDKDAVVNESIAGGIANFGKNNPSPTFPIAVNANKIVVRKDTRVGDACAALPPPPDEVAAPGVCVPSKKVVPSGFYRVESSPVGAINYTHAGSPASSFSKVMTFTAKEDVRLAFSQNFVTDFDIIREVLQIADEKRELGLVHDVEPTVTATANGSAYSDNIRDFDNNLTHLIRIPGFYSDPGISSTVSLVFLRPDQINFDHNFAYRIFIPEGVEVDDTASCDPSAVNDIAEISYDSGDYFNAPGATFNQSVLEKDVLVDHQFGFMGKDIGGQHVGGCTYADPVHDSNGNPTIKRTCGLIGDQIEVSELVIPQDGCFFRTNRNASGAYQTRWECFMGDAKILNEKLDLDPEFYDTSKYQVGDVMNHDKDVAPCFSLGVFGVSDSCFLNRVSPSSNEHIYSCGGVAMGELIYPQDACYIDDISLTCVGYPTPPLGRILPRGEAMCEVVKFTQTSGIRSENDLVPRDSGFIAESDFFVDLKINGSDSPTAVAQDSEITASWNSTGTASCDTYGHLVPLADGSGQSWIDFDDGKTILSGIKKLIARHGALGYVTPLTLSIECSNINNPTVKVRDTVSIPVTRLAAQSDFFVDLKVNGSDGPVTVSYDSINTATWNSVGTNLCDTSGTFVPLVDGGEWTSYDPEGRNRSFAIPPGPGELDFYARHNTLGYHTPLLLSISCNHPNNANNRVIDTVLINVLSPGVLNSTEGGDIASENPFQRLLAGLGFLFDGFSKGNLLAQVFNPSLPSEGPAIPSASFPEIVPPDSSFFVEARAKDQLGPLCFGTDCNVLGIRPGETFFGGWSASGISKCLPFGTPARLRDFQDIGMTWDRYDTNTDTESRRVRLIADGPMALGVRCGKAGEPNKSTEDVVYIGTSPSVGPFSVDLKVNNSNGPVTVPHNSIITASWDSQGVTRCNAYGHSVATVEGNTWTDFKGTHAQFDAGTSGIQQLVARNSTGEQATPLSISIECLAPQGSGPNKGFRDTVVVNVLPAAAGEEPGPEPTPTPTLGGVPGCNTVPQDTYTIFGVVKDPDPQYLNPTFDVPQVFDSAKQPVSDPGIAASIVRLAEQNPNPSVPVFVNGNNVFVSPGTPICSDSFSFPGIVDDPIVVDIPPPPPGDDDDPFTETTEEQPDPDDGGTSSAILAGGTNRWFENTGTLSVGQNVVSNVTTKVGFNCPGSTFTAPGRCTKNLPPTEAIRSDFSLNQSRLRMNFQVDPASLGPLRKRTQSFRLQYAMGVGYDAPRSGNTGISYVSQCHNVTGWQDVQFYKDNPGAVNFGVPVVNFFGPRGAGQTYIERSSTFTTENTDLKPGEFGMFDFSLSIPNLSAPQSVVDAFRLTGGPFNQTQPLIDYACFRLVKLDGTTVTRSGAIWMK